MKLRKNEIDIRFTRAQLIATHEALSNYTPKRGKPWRQSAQARAGTKVQRALMVVTNRL
jgi:hypothetical protein